MEYRHFIGKFEAGLYFRLISRLSYCGENNKMKILRINSKII
jgi:hypothetical protein